MIKKIVVGLMLFVSSVFANCDSNETIVFTTDYLNGKTFYLVAYDDFGYGKMMWNMARMDFHESTVDWREYDTSDSETHSFDYSVNDGNITLDDGNGGTVISNPVCREDHIQVCVDDDCDVQLYFDEENAREFRDWQNRPINLFAGKTFYVVVGDEDGLAKGRISIDDNFTSFTFTPDGQSDGEVLDIDRAASDKVVWRDGDGEREETYIIGNYGAYLDTVNFENGELDSYIRLYPDAEKRDQYYDSMSNLADQLRGNSFHTVVVFGDGTDKGTAQFNQDLTHMTYTSDISGQSRDFNISAEGNRVVWYGDDSYSIAIDNSNGYIEAVDVGFDGSIYSYIRAYSDDDNATAYYTSLSDQNISDTLAGKTFYVVSVEEDGVEEGKVVFDQNLTSLTYTSYNDGESEEETFTQTGNKLVWSDGSYSIIIDNNGIYVELVDFDDDGSEVDSYTRLYTTKSQADEFFKSIGGKLPNFFGLVPVISILLQ